MLSTRVLFYTVLHCTVLLYDTVTAIARVFSGKNGGAHWGVERRVANASGAGPGAVCCSRHPVLGRADKPFGLGSHLVAAGTLGTVWARHAV